MINQVITQFNLLRGGNIDSLLTNSEDKGYNLDKLMMFKGNEEKSKLAWVFRENPSSGVSGFRYRAS